MEKKRKSGKSLPAPKPLAFGRTIRKLRREHDLTQPELAEKAGVTRSVVVGYETGHSKRPPMDVFEKIAQVFGLTLQQLRDLERAEEAAESSTSDRLAKVEGQVEEILKTQAEFLARVESRLKGQAAAAEPHGTTQQRPRRHA